jgi:hypothetical protein
MLVAQVFAIGFSLGANVLVNCLADNPGAFHKQTNNTNKQTTAHILICGRHRSGGWSDGCELPLGFAAVFACCVGGVH